MKKLDHVINISIPENMKSDFDVDSVIYEIYYMDDAEEDCLFWEVYGIKLQNTDDLIKIKILKIAMDFSREIEENGGGPIEEFIFRLFLNDVFKHIDEKNTRTFIEEISD